MFNIIPAIDILDGKVVRLTQGDYDKVQYFSYQPDELANFYADQGAPRIHLVDLNGAKEGRLVNETVFQKIRRSVSCELECGGGIRSQDSLRMLFDLGIDFLVLGSVLIHSPNEALQWFSQYPHQLIAGIDARGEEIAVQGWKEKSGITIETLLNGIQNAPVSAIIYTDIEKDGMLSGPNLKRLKWLTSKTNFPIIASGGVSSLEDIAMLKQLESKGITGCIVGKALLSGKMDTQILWK